MVFKEKTIQTFTNIWVNINEQYDYNEWHNHPGGTLSGVYYIKHDGSKKHGNILFKHPKNLYLAYTHWPEGLVEQDNEITAEIVNFTPTSNMLLIFPSWLEHKVEANLKNDSRISLSFNTTIIPSLEKKS